MKKFINKTEDITKELLEGYVLAYQDRVCLLYTSPSPRDTR